MQQSNSNTYQFSFAKSNSENSDKSNAKTVNTTAL